MAEIDHRDNPEVGHEQSDVNVRGILVFGAVLVVAAAIIHVLIYILYVSFGGRTDGLSVREYPMTSRTAPRLPAQPRLQDRPREDLRALRAQQQEELTTYGWVDVKGGVVRVPIDEAMKQVLQRGLPVLPEAGRGGSPAAAGRPSDSSSGRMVEVEER